MKLCDRCRVSGCCLNYLAEACKRARKQECPDVVYTNADELRDMSNEELAIALVKYEGTEKRNTRYGGHEHIFYGPNGEKCESKAEAVGMWFMWLSKPAKED